MVWGALLSPRCTLRAPACLPAGKEHDAVQVIFDLVDRRESATRSAVFRELEARDLPIRWLRYPGPPAASHDEAIAAARRAMATREPTT